MTMQVFSPDWFEHHQAKLLWLLNHWLTRRWFRWVLCIRRCDIGYDKRILALLPHAYTVLLGQESGVRSQGSSGHGPVTTPASCPLSPDSCLVATDFRTHPKYAKRLFYAFAPIWWTMHGWDWLLADRWVPRLSFGFATLTVYPDPGSGATTVAGVVYRIPASETFSTIRNGAGDGVILTDCGVILESSTTTNQFDTLSRNIATFDTHVLGGFDVLDAYLGDYGTGKSNGLGAADLHVTGATPGADDTLVAADYGQCQATSFGSISYANFTNDVYNNITLNASGLANINNVGISRFSQRLHWDMNNSYDGSWVSNVASRFDMTSANPTGTATDIKLVVTYTITGRFAYQNKLRPAIFTPGHAR